MDAEEARTIGRRVRQVRRNRDKSLRVVAGLAGMSKSQLDRIERGKVALDRLSDIVALADALQIAPSDLVRLPIPAPANGHTDSTTEAVRLALDAIDIGWPNGLSLPVAVLRDQVARIHQQRRACQFAEVATDLPGLIRIPAHDAGHRHRARRAARPRRVSAPPRHPSLARPRCRTCRLAPPDRLPDTTAGPRAR